MQTFTFHQNTPSAVWDITHNLNKYVACDAYFEINGKLTKVLPASVEHIDLNNIKVTFSSPQIGKIKIA